MIRCTSVEATNYIEYSAPLVHDLQVTYLHSDGFMPMYRAFKSMPNDVRDLARNATISTNDLEVKKHFTICAFAVTTTAMSDDTSYYDEDLPSFDKNTIENILYCKRTDADDMRKFEALFNKMRQEVHYRAQACSAYIAAEQKMINDDHRMYAEHFELLPWVME